jgi:competence protein ComEC
MAEVGAGRLLPWLAVAFGAGIVLYFTAEHEPALWAVSAATGAGIIAAVLLRRRPIAFVLALGLLAVCAGFAVATIKAALIAYPVLRYPAYSVSLAGFVTLREESQKSDRFVMRVERIERSWAGLRLMAGSMLPPSRHSAATGCRQPSGASNDQRTVRTGYEGRSPATCLPRPTARA